MVDWTLSVALWIRWRQPRLRSMLGLVTGLCFCPILVHSQTNLDAVPRLADFLAAAQQGDPKSQVRLAETYAGLRDSTNAAAWYRKAADLGEPRAQWQLARYYDFGVSPVPLDRHAAQDWYRKAAVQGFANAQLDLGQIYERGHPGEPDYIEAYKWYTIAVSNRCVLAKINRERLILKMTYQQVEEGQKRAEDFTGEGAGSSVCETPVPPPKELTLVERPLAPQPAASAPAERLPSNALEFTTPVSPLSDLEKSESKALASQELTPVQQTLAEDDRVDSCSRRHVATVDAGLVCLPVLPSHDAGYNALAAVTDEPLAKPASPENKLSLLPVLSDAEPAVKPSATVLPATSGQAVKPMPKPAQDNPVSLASKQPPTKSTTRPVTNPPIAAASLTAQSQPKWAKMAEATDPKRAPVKDSFEVFTTPAAKTNELIAQKPAGKSISKPQLESKSQGESRLSKTESKSAAQPTVVAKTSAQEPPQLPAKISAEKVQPPVRRLPPPEPAIVSKLQLKGIAAFGNRRMATVNGCNLYKGEEANLTVDGKVLKLRCTEIQDRSAFVQIDGFAGPIELTLAR